MTAVAERPMLRKARVTGIAAQLVRVEITADDPALDVLICAYRNRFGLGPRDRKTERAETFFSLRYHGRTVAVFGERRAGERREIVEVTDGYHDGTRVGKIAFAVECHRYLHRLRAGEFEGLAHRALAANVKHWQTVMRESGDPPHSLLFYHRRKEV